ncbi:MAG: polyamine aminopropyltransferase [Lachnospiraceae bacterium]|nr:polyamine aminopropyltransferase [Lachnospiraceae bacterium]
MSYNLWLHTDDDKSSFNVDRQIFSAQTDYQRVDIYESKQYGRILTLDGDVLFSSQDEFVYNEMAVHVPMAVHPHVKKVLIIGGGDGGVASELISYPEITQIDIVEPDEEFVNICREYFPETSRGFRDSRVHIYHMDGLRFLRRKMGEYDLIINDSTDPFGYTEGLFTKEFYGSCYHALKEDGIMIYQHGSPFFDEDETAFQSMHRRVYRVFPICRVYQAHIPTCPAGYWTFGFASKKYHPLNDFHSAEWNARNLKTWYYTTNLHLGSFLLPRYVEDLLITAER